MQNHSATKPSPRRAIRFRTFAYNTIYDVMIARKWKETESEQDWDFNWADRDWLREHYDTLHMNEFQRLNHFRNSYELCRKDLLIKNLKRTKKALEKSNQKHEATLYDFHPPTYVLPSEYGLFQEEFHKHPTGSLWIMKPIGKAQGRGIFLFTRMSQVSEWRKTFSWDPLNRDENQVEDYIAQRYIENPYLIGGRKFDMRIYVLVTSFNPLTIWICRKGFARFTFTRYNLDKDNISNTSKCSITHRRLMNA